jgi:hypothetical protein
MAGTILITEKEGLATSTVEFDYLVERIRHAFLPEDSEIVSAIYEPLDEGGMTFISAADLGDDKFQTFVRAVRRAYAMSAQEASFHDHKDRWIELIKILDKDQRSRTTAS